MRGTAGYGGFGGRRERTAPITAVSAAGSDFTTQSQVSGPAFTSVPTRLAVLIDADNAQAGMIPHVLEEVAKYGQASVKRVFGDWTTQQLSPWKRTLHAHAMQPVQSFAFVSGKNATDSALIIDAMDLLHSRDVGGFVLVSSDSDFTRLAARIRESGLLVIGIGERKTPDSFVAACDRFIFVESLRPAAEEAEGAGGTDTEPGEGSPGSSASSARAWASPLSKPKDGGGARALVAEEPWPRDKLQGDAVLRRLLLDALDSQDSGDEWQQLSVIGDYALRTRPEFDPRLWGYKKLSELVKATGFFDVSMRKTTIMVKPNGQQAKS